MLIGEDFEKIQFDVFGLHLMEPNAFIGDMIIFIVALLIARRVKQYKSESPFFNNWYWFFIVFGTGFFVGGIGHLFYHYLGAVSKYPPLYLGLISAVFIERGMVSLITNATLRLWLNRVIIGKLILALTAATIVFINYDMEIHPEKGLRVTTINGAIGSIYVLGYLGIKFGLTISKSFHFMWLAMLVLLPVAIIQSNKINLHQWFDRNDLSHLFVTISILFYYVGIKGYIRKWKAEQHMTK